MKNSICIIVALVWQFTWMYPPENALETVYVAERLNGIEWISVDTFTIADLDTFQGLFGTVWTISARALGCQERSGEYHVLACDWSDGISPVLVWGSGGLSYTAAGAWLTTNRWTCTFAFVDSIPTWIRCTCEFDYTGDGLINLSDLPGFAAHYPNDLSALAALGVLYGKSGVHVWP